MRTYYSLTLNAKEGYNNKRRYTKDFPRLELAVRMLNKARRPSNRKNGDKKMGVRHPWDYAHIHKMSKGYKVETLLFIPIY